MLIFYYGLLFLATLCISDGVATFLVLCLVDFLLLKAIWEDYKPLKLWKEWLNEHAEDWKEWWKHLSGLRRTYFVLAIIISPIFIGTFVVIFPEFIAKRNDPTTTFYNLSLAVFAILSGLGAIFGFYTSIMRTEIQEQGLITDRINKAIEGIGKNDAKGAVVEVRLGALYTLERIAQDSIRDHLQIIEILCAYIRHNNLIKNNYKGAREDIKIAAMIIGRREQWQAGKKRINKERDAAYRIILHACNLQDTDFYKANLCQAGLLDSNMSEAIFMEADLSDAWICGANLNHTIFKGANMAYTQTRRAFSYDTDFSECKNLTQEQLDVMYCGKDVEIPKMDGKKKLTRPNHWPKNRLSLEDFTKEYNKWHRKTYPERFENP